MGGPRYPGDGPARDDLLREVATAMAKDTFLNVKVEGRTASVRVDDGQKPASVNT